MFWFVLFTCTCLQAWRKAFWHRNWGSNSAASSIIQFIFQKNVRTVVNENSGIMPQIILFSFNCFLVLQIWEFCLILSCALLQALQNGHHVSEEQSHFSLQFYFYDSAFRAFVIFDSKTACSCRSHKVPQLQRVLARKLIVNWGNPRLNGSMYVLYRNREKLSLLSVHFLLFSLDVQSD